MRYDLINQIDDVFQKVNQLFDKSFFEFGRFNSELALADIVVAHHIGESHLKDELLTVPDRHKGIHAGIAGSRVTENLVHTVEAVSDLQADGNDRPLSPTGAAFQIPNAVGKHFRAADISDVDGQFACLRVKPIHRIYFAAALVSDREFSAFKVSFQPCFKVDVVPAKRFYQNRVFHIISPQR